LNKGRFRIVNNTFHMKTFGLIFFVVVWFGASPELLFAQTPLWLKKIEEQREKIAREKETSLVQEIYRKIIATAKPTNETEMKSYTNLIHGSRWQNGGPVKGGVDFPFIMVPIRGGEFMMGSPQTETNRHPDEGPQHKVKVSPFWMQQCEMTWDAYEPFMYDDDAPKRKDPAYVSDSADLVAKPSKPYMEMSFGMGKGNFPAIGMTQHAANKYCEWLSAKTGHFYRLPTEAEWEYACRAGTTTAYSFGDDPKQLGDYAWFSENSQTRRDSERKYQKVGTKKPNAWGLHDMHGNVAEWCLDQYDPEFYLQGAGKILENPWNKATRPYPHVLRGGAWDEVSGAPDQLRSAARQKSDKSWKGDVQLPPTFWYMVEYKSAGFRIVRPLKIPSEEEVFRCWNSGVENEMLPQRKD
jgi:formylglycine-generating enzyme required for sulfatase activity